MISHDKAVTMHCAGPQGCGKMHKSVVPEEGIAWWRMCVGKECMAWEEYKNKKGDCLFIKEKRVSILETMYYGTDSSDDMDFYETVGREP